MIKFIVCDSAKEYLLKNENFINKIMMENDFQYEIQKYKGKAKEIPKILNQEGPKIYIIGIELVDISGIDLVKKIRKNDFQSIVIILSSRDDLKNRLFRSGYMIFKFISKQDDYINNLNQAINNSLKILGKKHTLHTP